MHTLTDELVALIDDQRNEDVESFLRKEGTSELMSEGFLLIERAMKVESRSILRLLLAFGIDEGLTDTQFEKLSQMKVYDLKLLGLIKAANILEDINLPARIILRDNFFSRFIRHDYDWCTALYGLNNMEGCWKLLNTPEEHKAYICFLNTLAKIDLCSDDEYANFNCKQLFIVDFVTSCSALYTITEDLSLGKIFQIHFERSNEQLGTMIWEQYQQFAEFRCFTHSVSLDTTLSHFDSDSDFCVLQLRYAKGLNRNIFDFISKRFIDETRFEAMLESPGMLIKKVNDCFSFIRFVKDNKDKLSIFMPIILKDENLFLRIFLGVNAENKLPFSMILEDITQPEFEPYKKDIEQEALFWQTARSAQNPIQLFDEICKLVKESDDTYFLGRLLNYIEQLISQYRIDKSLIESFNVFMRHVTNTQAQLAAVGQQPLLIKTLSSFIEGMKKIEERLKLPSLKMISFYAVKKKNDQEELKNLLFKSIDEEEEKKSVFGKK